MTDGDLYLLHREEMRLYHEYVHALTEEARYPSRIARKRDAWVAMNRKLRTVLSPESLRLILQERGFKR